MLLGIILVSHFCHNFTPYSDFPKESLLFDLLLKHVGTSVHRALLLTFVKGDVEAAGF